MQEWFVCLICGSDDGRMDGCAGDLRGASPKSGPPES
eukprot:CAMPEP_0198236176 /NCGR_PEP_ID=MMETSP1446-20131203/2089_1 /TAXON_ID=1461542 ORGANISM="Unidentified sp, Strain CCMP2111" /NCGR_SAMPLE_ID=MMETSP1446 /ASSEMBLY_ACC=CAM_ASM_001112 /LENGTH=36 /DNA_ID= /DNA_START= /DNA_END= /DNA_ORIENTATION=